MICPAVWLSLHDSHGSDQWLLNHSLFALLVSTQKTGRIRLLGEDLMQSTVITAVPVNLPTRSRFCKSLCIKQYIISAGKQ